jgi:hypothetical protein
MLSIYVPINKKSGDIDLNQELDEKEFIQNTFVSVRYRTHTEKEEKQDTPGFQTIIKKKQDESSDEDEEADNKEENKYYSSVNVYHLKDFAQGDWDGSGKGHIAHQEEAFVGSSAYKDSDIFP